LSEHKPGNIKLVVETVSKATTLTRPQALALHLYLHAVMHKSDPSAVASGLQAAKFIDASEATLWAPVDCLMGTLVSQFGFETVANWTDDELTEGLDKLDLEVAFAAALEYIEKDKAEQAIEAKSSTENEAIKHIMSAMPADVTKH
jgi:hypothetical protein